MPQMIWIRHLNGQLVSSCQLVGSMLNCCLLVLHQLSPVIWILEHQLLLRSVEVGKVWGIVTLKLIINLRANWNLNYRLVIVLTELVKALRS